MPDAIQDLDEKKCLPPLETSSGPSCGEILIISSALWLLVFDLDGTLIDSSKDLCTSVNAALAHAGRPTLSEPTITSFIGNGAAALVRRSLAAAGDFKDGGEEPLFASTFSYFLEHYRTHKLDTTRTYPGTLESLRHIRAGRPDLLMAVLTNKPVNPSKEICAALGLAPFFFVIYGGDSFATKKPAPEGLTKIMQEARDLQTARGASPATLHPSGVVMIGDSAVDIQVGRVCETRTLGCSYGLAPESLGEAGPDAVVAAPYQWPAILGL